MIGGLNQKHQLIQFSDQEINSAFQSFQRRMAEYSLFQIRNKAVYLNSHSDDEDDEENEENVQQHQKVNYQQQKTKTQSDDLLIIDNPNMKKNKEKKHKELAKSSKTYFENKNEQVIPTQVVQNGARKTILAQNNQPQSIDHLESLNKRLFIDQDKYSQKPCARKSNML